MTIERFIAVMIMVLGAAIFFGRETLAEMLPDTLAMRLILSVGGTVALLIQIIRFAYHRWGK